MSVSRLLCLDSDAVRGMRGLWRNGLQRRSTSFNGILKMVTSRSVSMERKTSSTFSLSNEGAAGVGEGHPGCLRPLA